MRLPFKPELVGGVNAFHGGAISSLLDLTGALAAWSGHDPEKGMKASTVTLTTNYVAAAQGTDIIATISSLILIKTPFLALRPKPQNAYSQPTAIYAVHSQTTKLF